MAPDLPSLLADSGIKLRRLDAGHNEKIVCPRCNGGRTREVSLSVRIDHDGAGATWQCHRGSCGWRDGGRVHSGDGRPVERHASPRQVRRPAPHTKEEQQNRPDWLYSFFAERNIGAHTVKTLGIYATRRRFLDPIGESDGIVFPYRWHGEVVNRKYRPFPAKTPQQQERDALPTLFNVDALGASPETVYWVEGEPDVAALVECGFSAAVSLKDGAPTPGVTDHGKRFDALATHAELLGKVKKFILAGDMDPPGLALREELARRLGRHRCWTVHWPVGCKDASDVLRVHGPEGVSATIAAAEPWPIDGLQQIKPGTLLALRAQPAPAVMGTGTRASDGIVKLPTEGRLIIVTGFPGSGKTSWVRFVMVRTAADHGRRWGVFSPEMQPWEQFAAECAEVYSGKPFWPVAGVPSMSTADITEAEEWLSGRVTMMVCDAEDEAPTLDWILERARAAVLRDGISDLLIDPWNEIDHQRGTMSETDYIGRGLQRLKGFALRHGCNVWIIAHPGKPLPLKAGEKRAAPGPYDISGSAHWANKADLGLTLHSPDADVAEVHVWKTRFRRWGRRGEAATLEFDRLCGRYRSPIRSLVKPANSLAK